MTCGASTGVRWLRLAVALLALLGGSGLHDALHAVHAPHDAHPASPFEAHAAGCEHLGDALPHDGGTCVLCKTGTQHARTPGNGQGVLAAHAPSGCLAPHAASRVPATVIPGELGARAPPVTVG